MHMKGKKMDKEEDASFNSFFCMYTFENFFFEHFLLLCTLSSHGNIDTVTFMQEKFKLTKTVLKYFFEVYVIIMKTRQQGHDVPIEVNHS